MSEFKPIEATKDEEIIIVKKIKALNLVNIMNNIIDNNTEIVNNIREIYSIAWLISCMS